MNLILNVPEELEAIIKKRADEAGVDLQDYVLQTLRSVSEDGVADGNVSDQQFADIAERIQARHADANPHFDDSRESIYAGRDE